MQTHIVIDSIPATPMKGAGHRLTIALVSLCIVLVTFLEPTSLRSQVVTSVGEVGWAFTYLTSVMSAISVLDVIVNDLMPDRYFLPRTLKYRMYACMLQAMMHVSMAVAILAQDSTPWAAAINVVLAFSCVWVAVSDTYYRYIAPRQRTNQA